MSSLQDSPSTKGTYLPTFFLPALDPWAYDYGRDGGRNRRLYVRKAEVWAEIQGVCSVHSLEFSKKDCTSLYLIYLG